MRLTDDSWATARGVCVVPLCLADAEGDPFDGEAVAFRILAGVLTAPKRARKRASRRRKVAAVVHFRAVARLARDAMLCIAAGLAVGTAVATLLVTVAPVMARLGGIA